MQLDSRFGTVYTITGKSANDGAWSFFMGVTLKDLAAASGLSIRSVRRALQAEPGVSDTARKRITELAARLGYVPNVAARDLRTGRTAFIGLLSSPRDTGVVRRRTLDLIDRIGAVGLHLSDDLKQGDLGFIFNRRFWGSGYASEAAQGMLRFGFMNLDLHRITAKCDSENLASEAVMKRIGMRKEGETKKSVYTKVRGKEQWRSEKLYAMLQKEFLNALIELGEL